MSRSLTRVRRHTDLQPTHVTLSDEAGEELVMCVCVCRMSVYGTCDAGRGLWEKLTAVADKHELRQSSIMPALFFLRT